MEIAALEPLFDLDALESQMLSDSRAAGNGLDSVRGVSWPVAAR